MYTNSKSLFDGTGKNGDHLVLARKQSMLKPSKSTRNVMKPGDKLNHVGII